MLPNSPDVCPPRPVSVHPGPPGDPVDAPGLSPLAAQRPAAARDDSCQKRPAGQVVTRKTTSPITPRLSTALSLRSTDSYQPPMFPIGRKRDLPRIERTCAGAESKNA